MEITWNLDIEATKKILSDLYRDPLEALFRELISNAITATLIANVNQPVKVFINENEIIITDEGIGMTPEEFENNFMCFGNSLNAKYDGVIGQFGIGAKVILSIIGKEGYATLTTKSRKTKQALKARITINGAVYNTIKDAPFGTTIAIHLPKPIKEYITAKPTLENEYDFIIRTIKAFFQYSRVPIIVKTPTKTEQICQPNLKLLDKTDSYEIYKKDYNTAITDVVIADVTVTHCDCGPYVVRILKEGETVQLAPGVSVELPKSHLSRDSLTLHRNTIKALIARANLLKILERVKDLTTPLNAKNIDRATFTTIVQTISNYLSDSTCASLVRAIIPEDVLKTLEILTTSLPIYGFKTCACVYHYDRKTRREHVTIYELIQYRKFYDHIYYTTKRISSTTERVLSAKGFSVVYTTDDSTLRLLREIGIQPLPSSATKGVYILRTYRRDLQNNLIYDATTLEELMYYLKEGRVIAVFVEKVSQIPEYPLDGVVYVIGPLKIFRKLRSIFGDLVLSLDKFQELLKRSILVTDGYNVFPLIDTNAQVVQTCPIELLPLSKQFGTPIVKLMYSPIPTAAERVKTLKIAEKVFALYSIWENGYDALFNRLIDKYYNDFKLPKPKSEEELKKELDAIEPPKMYVRIPPDLLNMDILLPPLEIPFIYSHAYSMLPSIQPIEDLGRFWTIVLLENYNKLPKTVQEWLQDQVSKIIEDSPEQADFYLKYYPQVLKPTNIVSLL